MKRTLSAILCLVMILSVALCMTACGGDSKGKETLVGTWRAHWDMGTILNEAIGESMADAGMDNCFDFTGVTVDLVFEFTEEGKAKLSTDEDTVEDCADALVEELIDGFKKYFEENSELTGGMSLEDLVAASGMTMEEFVNSALGSTKEELITSMTVDVANEGYYKLDGNKLYIENDKEDLKDSDDYQEVELNGDTLIVTIDEDTTGISEIKLTFKREK